MKSELKIKPLTSAEISDAVCGELKPIGKGLRRNITSVCTASNEATAGALFCAIKGERVDGHDFISDAIRNGAVCVLAERIPETLPDSCVCDIITVANTVKALGSLAGYYRGLSEVRCIGVTGSVGKTTTKEFISAVLSTKFKTHKSEGNHNNEIGMPMTLLDLSPDDEVAVIEMGMSAFGEISYLSRLARPEAAVITNIGTAHLASLGTRENICKAKTEMLDGMSAGSKLFVNTDEPLLAAVLGKRDDVEKIKFSVDGSDGDYRATNIKTRDDGMEYDLICRNRIVTNVFIPVFGRHNVYNSLVAFAIGHEFGIGDSDIKKGLSSFVNTGMRQKIYSEGSITIIEDCYNASPESMRAALDVLAGYVAKNGGTPVALLGDMLELGEDTYLMHEQIGQYVGSIGVKKLFCYGKAARIIAESAIRNGIRAENIYVCADTDNPHAMAEMMNGALEDGDVILVKASRGIKAEKVLEALKTIRAEK